MGTKVRSISRESSRKRIEELRKHSGSLIGAKRQTDFIDNVFNNNNPDQFNGPVTMSLYNQGNKARPFTAPLEGQPSKNNWLKKYEKLQPVPEEGVEAEIKDTRLPDFKPPSTLRVPFRTDNEGYRHQQLQEIESIKIRLAADHCLVDVKTLEKAIIMPDEFEFKPGERLYPKIE